MKGIVILLVISSLLSTNCRKPCDCSSPINGPTKWKITDRSGGISGGHVVLTEEQKNNVLTWNIPGGKYICTNTVTGVIINGSYSMSNFTSIYGDRQKVVFTPKLPMLAEDFLVLIDNPTGKMIFGDNIADGYLTTFEFVP